MSNRINLKKRLDDFWVFPKLTKVKDKRDYSDGYFKFLQVPDKEKIPTSLYIHIPFCDSHCSFCPYYKLHGGNKFNENISRYLAALVTELKKYARTPYFDNKKIESVHFGGGNPLLMNLEHFRIIVDEIKSHFNVDVNGNWSLEGSINAINNENYVKGLLALGINRISFGIQTFNENIRKKTHIKTKLHEIYRGVQILRKAGLTEYCVDMMYNMPDQTMADLYADLAKVDDLDPYHIDIYNMAVFPNTHLDKLLKTTDYFQIKPSNENQITMYRAAHHWLKEHGYRQITTSTYSKRQEKPHIGDYLYLTNNNVLGIGVSSRGYLDGYAYKNVCTLNEYLEQLDLGNFPADLSHRASREEHADRTMVFFPILLSIHKERIADYSRYEHKINKIIEMGLAEWVNDTLVLTEEGIVWSGNISAYFIGKDRWNTYINSFLTSLKEKTNPYNEDLTGVTDSNLESKC